MRKLLALATAAALAISLVACGGGGNDEADTGDNNQSSAENGGAETPADSGDTGETSTGSGEIQDVTLTMWGGEEDQNLLREISDAFIEEHKDEVNLTINIGPQSESGVKDTILTDPEAAADVFAFADDQINELVKAGALQEVQDIEGRLSADDIKTRNVAGAVDAATVDGKLYAFPLTADNGYFMFYDKSVFPNPEDVETMDRMVELAAAAGKKVSMEVTSGWYFYSFFGGDPTMELGLADDGVTTVCNWNTGNGPKIAQAIMDLASKDGFISQDDGAFKDGIANGTVAAGINGTWNATLAQEAWGENYAACKLPTYTVDGQQQQMASYAGYKLLGVNPHSKNVGWAMLLAEYVTNAENETKRFEQRGQGPANIEASESEAVQNDPAMVALAEQNEFSSLQRVGANYWDPAQTMGKILVEGGGGKDVQAILDEAVAGITAPVVE